jgi:1-acyl-sn-glycerol-3-phosphate acyltransferase
MEAKTGVARLALRSGAPVLPMASWGSQAVWQKSGKGSLRPGRPILTKVGEPLAFARDPSAAADRWRAVTAEVMEAITGLTVELRDRYPRSWR